VKEIGRIKPNHWTHKFEERKEEILSFHSETFRIEKFVVSTNKIIINWLVGEILVFTKKWETTNRWDKESN
jgi:hypothetical protein